MEQVELREIVANAKTDIVDGPFGSNLKLSDYIDESSDGVPVLTTKNLEGNYSPDEVRFISKEKFETLKRSSVLPGDILVAKIGSVGKTGRYPVDAPVAIIPANLLKVTVDKSKVDCDYVYHYFNSPVFQAAIRSICTATAQPAFNVTKFRSLMFPLVPLPQQRRIVEAIELQLGRLDAAVARLQGAKARLKRYKQAVLKAAVDEANEEAEGLFVRLDEVADLCLGKMLDKQKNKGTPHPYLRNINVRWDSFDTDDLHQMPFQDHEHERYGLEFGDLVVCEGGEPGRCAVWDGSIPDMKIQKALHRVRCSPQADPYFVMYSLLYGAWSGSITKYYTGTTIKHLTGKSLAGFQLVLPHVKVQKRLVAGVRNAFAATDETESVLDTQLQQTVRLRQAVLKRAFEGRLI